MPTAVFPEPVMLDASASRPTAVFAEFSISFGETPVGAGARG